MNKIAIGTPMEGGFLAGRICINEQEFNLIVSPKAEGEANARWNGGNKFVEGAKSFFDGLSNTNAMVDAGSDLAKWARDLRIGGNDDWYLPSQDELEIIYRNLKPTTETNSQYGRSGINLSALPPTYPYAEELPAQTSVGVFQKDGVEAFNEVAYWSSTQHAAYAGFAWYQDFYYGGQSGSYKSSELCARAVRRSLVI